MRRTRKWTLIASIFAILVSIALPSVISAVEGIGDRLGPLQGEPEIDIQITPAKHEAHVGPGDDGIVTISGTVICEVPPYIPSNVYCVVQLSASTGGWPSSNPPQLAFSNSQTQQSFTINVQVPLFTPPDESRDIQITGTWMYSPGTQGGTTETENVFVTVLPYVYLVLSSDGENATIEVGEETTFTVDIENRGTETATVSMSASADDDRMEVVLERTSTEIGPHQTVQVGLTAGQASGSQGQFTITMTAEDSTHGTQGPIRLTFKVITREKEFSITSIPYLTPIMIVAVIILLVAGSALIGRKIIRTRREGQ